MNGGFKLPKQQPRVLWFTFDCRSVGMKRLGQRPTFFRLSWVIGLAIMCIGITSSILLVIPCPVEVDVAQRSRSRRADVSSPLQSKPLKIRQESSDFESTGDKPGHHQSLFNTKNQIDDSEGAKHLGVVATVKQKLLNPQRLPKPVRLLRVPKAGSSSFSAFLRLQYNCTSEEYPPGDCTKRNQLQCKVVEGCNNHLPLSNWKIDDNVNPMITFVREPVLRYLSAYKYPGHHGKGTGGNITKHTILFPEYDNTQTNFFSQNPIGTWQSGSKNKARTKPPDTKTSNEEWEQRLQEALDLLDSDHLKFVGLLEHWKDSLRLFCRMFECSRGEDSWNTKQERQQSLEDYYQLYYADSSAREAVRKSNAVDARLYQAAVHRFCRDLANYQGDAAFLATLNSDTIQLCNGGNRTTSTSTAQR